MYKKLIIGILSIWTLNLSAQVPNAPSEKERLDFAKTYFEYGGSLMPSFTGKRLQSGQVTSFEQPASVSQYLTWGAFHFWGHTEFYVTIPLKQDLLTKNEQTGFQLLHSATTGVRLYPWAMKAQKIRPYAGLHWGALDFKQIIKPDENQTTLSKDFLLNYEVGVAYTYKKLGVRLGVNYLPNNKWDYPISKTTKSDIKTPPYAVQFGLLYAFDASKNEKKEKTDLWNKYPRVSKLSHDAAKTGDFFLGIGPSFSYSVIKSDYNTKQFPYLKEKLTSNNYFDMAIGYQFNKANLFTALSFRNPTYETEGYGTTQTIKKMSLALEINKFLTDYSGFAPYIGLNLAYDNLTYNEDVSGVKRTLKFKNKLDAGVTFGWDIVPGKTSEALILRTNLRWYPMSKFAVDGKQFNFSQLEYNLIQVVFYPDRLKKRRK